MAIAFDNATDGGTFGFSATATFNHTCTGSDLMLFVSFANLNISGSPGSTATCTYNGVSMTLEAVSAQAPGSFVQAEFLFSLKNPDTGSNQVVATVTDAGSSFGTSAMAASYTGVDVVTAVQADEDSGTTYSNEVTPTVSGSWTFLAVKNPTGEVMSASTGSTTVISNANGMGIFDSGGTVATGSPYVMDVTTGSSVVFNGIIVAFSPAGGGGGRRFFLV